MYVRLDLPEPEVLTSVAEIQEMVDELLVYRPEVAYDTETSGLSYYVRCYLITIAYRRPWAKKGEPQARRILIPTIGANRPLFMGALKNFFESYEDLLSAHNGPYDYRVMENHGILVSPLQADTMKLHHVYDEEEFHALKNCSKKYLDINLLSFTEIFGKKPTEDTVREAFDNPATRERVIEYATLDAWATLELLEFLRERTKRLAWWPPESMGIGTPRGDGYCNATLWDLHRNFDRPLLEIVQRMHRRGVPFDKRYLRDLQGPIQKDMDKVTLRVCNRHNVSINLGSYQQVSKFLFETLGYRPYERTDGGGWSTNESSLKKLVEEQDCEVGKDILEHRTLRKSLGFVKGLADVVAKDGRIHAEFMPILKTGRMQGKNPNLLNLPKVKQDKYKIRRAVRAEEGRILLVLDYDQLELRLVAGLSQDLSMIEAIQKGLDLHADTCVRMYGLDYEEIMDMRATDDKLWTPRQKDLAFARDAAKKCVHPDTIVTLNGVTQSILSAAKSCGLSENFKVKVENSYVADGKGNSARILCVHPPRQKRGVHVISRRGVLTCSYDHPFELEDGSIVCAQNLKKTDILAETDVPVAPDAPYPELTYKPLRRVPEVKVKLDNNVAYFAGLFVGDGVQAGDHSVGISHGPTDKKDSYGTSYQEWRDIIRESAKKIGLTPSDRTYPEHNIYQVYLGARHTQRYFNALGIMKGSKRHLRVPDWVFKAGRTALLYFIAGLMDSDGSSCKRSNSGAIVTKDPILAGQLFTAIRSCGMTAGVELIYNEPYQKHYFRIRVFAADMIHLKPFIRHPGKSSIIRERESRRPRANQVLRVLPAGRIKTLDLTLETEDHIYLTNGLRTHNTGFGIVYGIGPPGLAAQISEDLGVEYTAEQAEEDIERFFDARPGVASWIESTIAQAHEVGYVTSVLGRFRRPSGIHHSSYSDRGRAERQVVNFPVQASAADLICLAMIALDNDPIMEELDAKMILQVHDELMWDCKIETAQQVKEYAVPIMENPPGWPGLPGVILTASGGIGPNWAEAKH